MGWLVFLSGIAIFILLIWFMSVRIKIVYERTNENDRIDIEISVLKRLLKYRFTVNQLQIRSISEGIKVSERVEVGQQAPKRAKKTRITPRTIQVWQWKFARLLRNVYDLNQILRRTLENVRGEELIWKTNIGLGEASATGAVVGVVWTVKSALIALLSHYISLRARPRLYVIPDFQREMLDIYLLCILRLRIGHAIIAVIRIMINYIRKGRERVWENIRFKA
ncbi:DUF2953 domain-containing protein [Aneurinibacillus thermoaerophilus]|uniref:DUF2953 domain-containing protein n=1 Tax=Aneurinibacillus thermoaerophilus TaxID=143495 RepID=UPI002E24E618|nr:DUF2953 domain-containing protein [Aneurinibacillus thermoaerophilus]MED0756427.1 DUF2953 domain-containing protein [Aneurinibacillus thermoaerophilus]MED0761174.1 DUF2953 domain-containing protein [Aneurinibacillus thermoaerophilus]